jgi:hypothetical protein
MGGVLPFLISVLLDAHGYRISTSREFVVDPSGDGVAIGLLADRGLTPATRGGLKPRPVSSHHPVVGCCWTARVTPYEIRTF